MSNLKATAVAPSNLAFVKYWGRQDESGLRLPANDSISVCLDNLLTTTTITFDPSLQGDSVELDGIELVGESLARVSRHLNLLREIAGKDIAARVITKNSFPTGTGLSSSASGFAALTLAASSALGLDLSEIELSRIARQGSGSACRSIPSGFVRWHAGISDESSFAETIFNQDYWDLRFIVAVVSDKPKHVSTSKGQTEAQTSPYFAARQSLIQNTLNAAQAALQSKDFKALGELSEHEALQMHAVMMTQRHPLLYWTAGTLSLMQSCQQWRESGEVQAYFSVNTGQDIYFMCEPSEQAKLVEKLQSFPYVKDVIVNKPSAGARLV